MQKTSRDLSLFIALLIVGVCTLIWGLVVARSFLVPITVAALLAMLVLPYATGWSGRG